MPVEVLDEPSCCELLELVAAHAPLETVLARLELFPEHLATAVAMRVDRRTTCGGGSDLEQPPTPVDAWPEGLRAWAAEWRRGWLVPIRTGDGPAWGTLALATDAEGPLPSPDRERVRFAARLAGLAIEHDRLLSALDHQARFDGLTGLPNRVEALRFAEHALGRTGDGFAVMLLDVDRFKLINDTLGHAVGDAVLVEVAGRLRSALRATDLVARVGGDEFLLVVSGLQDAAAAGRVAEKLLRAFVPPFRVEGRELSVRASLGVATAPVHGTDLDTLQRRADAALYVAKQGGRNNWASFTESHQRQAEERLLLEHALRRAVEEGTFDVYYQPQVDRCGAVVSAEALLRWFHPTLGTISPGTFVPLAEETGLIVPLGAWLLRRVCADLREWRAAGLPEVPIAVNVSGVQFCRPDWHLDVVRQVEAAGIAPSQIQLELTESTLVENPAEVARMLSALRDRGFRVALDDFGTGYAGLAYLQKLPLDVLKIDQVFVRGLAPEGGGPGSLPIVRAIVALARGLSLKIVAEGVELDRQAEIVRDLGCDALQGFLFHRPMPASKLREVLAREVLRRSGGVAPARSASRGPAPLAGARLGVVGPAPRYTAPRTR